MQGPSEGAAHEESSGVQLQPRPEMAQCIQLTLFRFQSFSSTYPQHVNKVVLGVLARFKSFGLLVQCLGLAMVSALGFLKD